jgi:hypothetical protein
VHHFVLLLQLFNLILHFFYYLFTFFQFPLFFLELIVSRSNNLLKFLIFLLRSPPKIIDYTCYWVISGLLDDRKEIFRLIITFSVLIFDKISAFWFEAIFLNLLLHWLNSLQPFVSFYLFCLFSKSLEDLVVFVMLI